MSIELNNGLYNLEQILTIYGIEFKNEYNLIIYKKYLNNMYKNNNLINTYTFTTNSNLLITGGGDYINNNDVSVFTFEIKTKKIFIVVQNAKINNIINRKSNTFSIHNYFDYMCVVCNVNIYCICNHISETLCVFKNTNEFDKLREFFMEGLEYTIIESNTLNNNDNLGLEYTINKLINDNKELLNKNEELINDNLSLEYTITKLMNENKELHNENEELINENNKLIKKHNNLILGLYICFIMIGYYFVLLVNI